jgi:hypothetical protein
MGPASFDPAICADEIRFTPTLETLFHNSFLLSPDQPEKTVLTTGGFAAHGKDKQKRF